jgi:hypothetical protein
VIDGFAVTLPVVLVAVSVLGVPPLMAEMWVLHHRGNFHRWPMYVPVGYPPLFAAAGVLLLFTSAEWALRVYGVASALLVVMGALGAFFHVQGVTRQTGGFNLDNVMVGPPLAAPLSFSLLGVLGLLAVAYWNF